MIIKEYFSIDEDNWYEDYIRQFLKLYSEIKLPKKIENIQNEDVITIELNLYSNNEEITTIVKEIKELENKLKNKR